MKELLGNRFKLILSGLLLLVLMASCESGLKSSGETKPNIILIVSEDHGQDLGAYGNSIVTTPNIDALAENGVLFENAYTTYSVCSPSRGSILTGLYPHQNGQIGLATHDFEMYKAFDNIPFYLKEEGYSTGCLGKLHVNPESAFPFDFHEIESSNFAKEKMGDYAVKASEFIRAAGEQPFFLMVNFPDAHFPLLRKVEGLPTIEVTGDNVSSTLPFVGANTERLREQTADYYSQINRLDESIGMLLDSLKATGKAENTLIIFLSDHGAQFSRGKTTNYEAGLKIPLIVNWPGKLTGGQVMHDELVSVIDIFPTIVDAVSDQKQSGLPGKSLLAVGKGKDSGHEYIFAGGMIGTAKYFYPKRSVRGKQYKLIHNLFSGTPDPYFSVYTDHIYPTVLSGTSREEIASLSDELKEVYERWENPPAFEFYDLENDPWEFRNLADDPNYKEEMERLKRVLNNWRIDTRDPFMDSVNVKMIREEVDSINKYYPDHSYQKDSSFHWRYPDYFGRYVLEEN
ncbi:sulfatase family protein [Cyclobacterium qasimii]|uniref:Arylsulfatase n=2 Tax=Cyclobacterium qasimii TaxID=1350429 RepID=S7VHG2_9BACT|nr:sulfatase [Cyclobacterium qasimii]EPR69426.1 Arylsulfatase [Cyclobacterium qasimii M12-11B]GEO22096.1 sulfatase [Cyclobacterium qasimii]